MRFQKCPICDGTGVEELKGHFGNTSTTAPKQTCTVCHGKKIISSSTGLPPIYTSEKLYTPPLDIDVNGLIPNRAKNRLQNYPIQHDTKNKTKCAVCDEYIPEGEYKKHLRDVHDF